MRILSVLYVDTHGTRVSAHHQALELRRERALVGRYPLEGLESVILTGRVEITSDALDRCTRAGVRVGAISASGRVRFVVGGPRRGNVLLRIAQVQHLDTPAGLGLARNFVAGKIQNQRRLVQRWRWDDTGLTRFTLNAQLAILDARLNALTAAPTGDHVRGLEGDATRRYFKALGAHLHHSRCPLGFQQRSRRPPRDEVNALLGYLYGLITIEAVGALDAVGLDPQVGYLHQPRPGRPSLALDLIEEFRPVAERFAVGLLTRRRIGAEHFQQLPGGAYSLTDEGRRHLLAEYEQHKTAQVVHPLTGQMLPRAALPAVQATLLARTIRGDLPAYPPYVMAS